MHHAGGVRLLHTLGQFLFGLLGGLEVKDSARGFAAGWQGPVNIARQRPVDIGEYRTARIVRNGSNLTTGRAKTKTMKRESCRFLAARNHGILRE